MRTLERTSETTSARVFMVRDCDITGTPFISQSRTMKTRAEVVSLVRSRVRMLHFALSTEDAYCGWSARYYDFCRGIGGQLSAEGKAEAFLTDLAVRRKVAACCAGGGSPAWRPATDRPDGASSVWSGCRSGRSTPCTWCGWTKPSCCWHSRPPAAGWWRASRAAPRRPGGETDRYPGRSGGRTSGDGGGRRAVLAARHLGGEERRFAQRADANCHPADFDDAAAGGGHVDHSVSAHRGGAALPAAGARDAIHAFQSGADRLGAISGSAGDAAGDRRHVPPGVGADGKRAAYARAGDRAGSPAAAQFPGAVRARKRYPAVD